MIKHSEIPDILVRHGLDVRQLLHTEWPLLDMPLPELSADRIDYTLRDMYTYGFISKTDVERFLASISVQDELIVVQSTATAEWFVTTYYKEVIDFFLDPLHMYAYNRLAAVLSLALDKGILTTDDFLKDDEALLGKLYETGDAEVASQIGMIHPHVQVAESEDGFDIHQHNKVRIIDPTLRLGNGELVKSSLIVPAIKEQNEKALQKALKGTFVKVISC